MNWEEILEEINKFYNIYLNEIDLDTKTLLGIIIKKLIDKLQKEAHSDLSNL